VETDEVPWDAWSNNEITTGHQRTGQRRSERQAGPPPHRVMDSMPSGRQSPCATGSGASSIGDVGNLCDILVQDDNA
jgi:hypothetical protein